MSGGRPTKYTEAVQAAADEYVGGGFADCGDVVPSRAGLAVHLGVGRNTLANWAERHPAFLTTLTLLDVMQEKMALSGGLSSQYNSTIVKLLLANHGYSDKQAVDHSSSDGSMTPKVIERRVIDPSDTNP